MRRNRLYSHSSGFTLLEVLVSIAILAVAIVGFYQGQAAVTQITVRSEAMSQALYLAEEKMTELEVMLKSKAFAALPEEEKGEFKDEKLKNFKWKRELEKVDLGCFLPGETTKGEEGEEQSAAQSYFSLIDKVFENAVRKIKVTVEWTEGAKVRSVTIAQLYVNFKDLPRTQ